MTSLVNRENMQNNDQIVENSRKFVTLKIDILLFFKSI